jgi:hypothetical protein
LRCVGVAAIPAKPDARAVENGEMIALIVLRLGESGEVIRRAPEGLLQPMPGKAVGSIFPLSYQETTFP